MSKFEGNFNVYIKLARKLAFRLPGAKDRLKTLKWIKKIFDAKQVEENTRFHALHLLLICLQRKKLVSPFSENPCEDKMLASYNWTRQPDDIARDILSIELRENSTPPINFEVSNNFCDLLSYQEIPRFGVQFFYAFSPYEITKWHKLKKSIIPRSFLNKSITSNINKSSQYSFENVAQEKVFPRQKSQAFNAGFKPETQEDVTFTANLKANCLRQNWTASKTPEIFRKHPERPFRKYKLEEFLLPKDEPFGPAKDVFEGMEYQPPEKRRLSAIENELFYNKNKTSGSKQRTRKDLQGILQPATISDDEVEKSWNRAYQDMMNRRQRQQNNRLEIPVSKVHTKKSYDESAREDIDSLNFSKIPANPSLYIKTSRLETSLEKSRIKQIRKHLHELQNKMKRASYTLLRDEQQTVIDASRNTHTSFQGEVEPSFVTIPYTKQMQKFGIQPSESVETGVSILSDREMEDLFEEGDVASPRIFKIQGLENLPKELLHDVSYPHMYATGTSTYPNLGDESMPEYISDSNLTVISAKEYIPHSLGQSKYFKFVDNLQESNKDNDHVSILHESEMDDLFDESLVAKYLPEWSSSRDQKQISVDKEKKEGIFENSEFIGDTSFPVGMNTTVQSFPTQSEKLIYDESAPEDIHSLNFSGIPTNPSLYLETSRLETSLEKSRIKQIRKRLQELQNKMKRTSYTVLEDEQRTVIDASRNTHTSFQGEVEPSFVTIPYTKQMQKFGIQPSESVETGVSILSDREMEDLFEEGDVASPRIFKIQGLENLPKELLHDVSYPHMYATGTSTYPNLGDESMPEYISDSNLTVISAKEYIPHSLGQSKYGVKFVDNLQESNKDNDHVSILHESEMDDLFDESLVAKYLPEWSSSRDQKQISVDKEKKEGIFENSEFIGDTSFPVGMNTTVQSFPTQSEKLIYDESAPEDIHSLNFSGIPTNPSLYLETSRLETSLEKSRIKQIRKRLQELQNKMKRTSYTVLEDEQRTVIDASRNTHTSFQGEVEPSFVTIPYTKQMQKFGIQPSESVETGVSILSDREMEDLFEEGDVASPRIFKIQGLENLPKELLHDVSYPHMYATGTSTYPNLGDESMPEYISDSNLTVISAKEYIPHSLGQSKYGVKFVDNLQESNKDNDHVSILHESEMDDLFDESLVAKYLPEWSSSRDQKQISVDKEKKEGIFENSEFIGDTSFPVGMNTTVQSFPTQSEKLIYDESAPEDIHSLNFSGIPTNPSLYLETSRLETSLEKSRIKQIRKRLQELQNKMKRTSYTVLEDEQRTVIDASRNTHTSFQGEVEPSFVTIPYTKQMQKFGIQPSESVETGVSILSDREMEDLFEEGDVASPRIFKIQGLENLPKELLHDVSYPHMYATGTSTYPNLGDESMPEYISDSNLTVISAKEYIPHSLGQSKYGVKFVDNLQESNKDNDHVSILHESEMDDLFDESLVAKYLPEWSSSRDQKQISVDKEKKEGIFENSEFIGDTSFPVGMNTTVQSFPTQSEKLIYDESAPEDIHSLNFSGIPTNPSLYLETSRLETSLEKSRIKQIRKRLQELQNKMKRTSYTVLEDEQRTVIDASRNTHTSFQGEVEPSFVTIPYTKQMQKFGIQPSESVETGVSILSDREMEDLFEEGDVASPRIFKIQGLENLPKELLHDVSYPHMYATGTSTYPNLGDESMPEYISDSNLTVISAKEYIPHSLGQSKYFKFVDNLQESNKDNDHVSILHESEMDDLFDESLVAKYLPEWSSSRDQKQISVDKEKKEGIFENSEFIGDTSFPVGMNTTVQSFPTQSEKLIYDESAPEDIHSLNFSGIPTNPSLYLETSRLETSLEKSRIKQIRKRLQELQNKMKRTSYTVLEDEQRTVIDASRNTHTSFQGEVEPSFVTIPYTKQMQKFGIQPSESVETGVSILSDREMEDLFEEGDVASPRIFKIQGLENLPKELLHDVSYPHMYATGTSTYPNLGDESMPEYISDSNLTVISAKEYIPHSLGQSKYFKFVDNLQESNKDNDHVSILHESEMDDLFDESLVAKYLPEWSSSRDQKQISVDKEKKEGIFENSEFIGDTSFPVGMNTTVQSFPTQSEKLIYDESAPEDIHSLNFSGIPTNPSLYLETSRLETSLEKSRIKQIRKRLQELQNKMKRTSYTVLEDEQRTVIDASRNTHTSFQGEVEPSFVTIPYTKQMQKFGIQPSESVETGVSILSDREMEDLFEEGDVASPRIFKIQGLENLPKELLHDVSYPHMYATGTSTYPNLGDESMPEYISDSNLTVISVKEYIPHSLGQSKYFKFVDNLQESNKDNDHISILHESEMDDLFDESLVAKYLPEWSSSRDQKQISVTKMGGTSAPNRIDTTLQSLPTEREKLIYDESAPEGMSSLNFSRPTRYSPHVSTSKSETFLEKSRIKQIGKRLHELKNKPTKSVTINTQYIEIQDITSRAYSSRLTRRKRMHSAEQTEFAEKITAETRCLLDYSPIGRTDVLPHEEGFKWLDNYLPFVDQIRDHEKLRSGASVARSSAKTRIPRMKSESKVSRSSQPIHKSQLQKLRLPTMLKQQQNITKINKLNRHFEKNLPQSRLKL